ncbi:uncharacterized protein LOC107036589 isoform X2 [Diachasma alloeum]|uniref:uncharacterized protein LOC107036589 isoform X2 n=1 Tax=Diachasma alloeum TaxID=454923 RepID=UPI0007381C95|nr:uncharacterized protein LOC107036589 isoform X2 [Diachasma alloeum]
MENASENVACRFWFNSRLFVIDGQPLKFYLLGYNPLECRDIAKIIEAYGGKLSAPHGETIVFSEPHRVTDYDYDLYHIKCLYDSIMTNQLQDINHYRLISPSQPLTPVTPSSSETHDDRTSDISDPIPLKCKEERTDSEFDWNIRECCVKIHDFLEHTKDIKFFQPKPETSTRDKDESTSCNFNRSREAKKRLKNLELIEKLTNDRVQSTERTEVKSRCSSTRARVFPPENASPECSQNISAEESLNNTITSATNRGVIDVSEKLKEVTSRRRNVQQHSYEEFPTDISSSEEMTDSRRSNNRKRKKVSSLKRYLRPINSQGETSSPVKRSRRFRGKLFTEEEDRQIIQFLIDNNAISKATGVEIWKHVKAAMPHSTRTETNIRCRYMSNLRYNYAKYTDDPAISAEFAANVKSKRKGFLGLIGK